MAKFKSYKECITYIKNALDDDYCLISSDFTTIFTTKQELPLKLAGTYILFSSWRYRIIEIENGICSCTEADNPRFHNNAPAICKELDEHKMAIICGYYTLMLDKHKGVSFVDLGLPSGIMWASKDITCYGPSGYAWGEVKTKSTYTPKNALKRTKFSDIKADPKMDTARVIWGGKWRMPTIEEYQELLSLCEWKQRGYGYDVIGPNGNSVFFFSKPWGGEVYGTGWHDGGYCYWTCNSKEGEDSAACFRLGENIREIAWMDSYKASFVRPVFSENDSEHKEVFQNDPNAEEFCKGVIEKDGKYTEKFVYVGEQSHKGGNRATAKGYIKTGDIVDITFLGASEEPIEIRRWNPMWETYEYVSYMGENYFFEILANDKKKYIGKYGSYRETKNSKMGGCLDPKPERTRITQETVLDSFKGFKKWLLEGAKGKEDWHFIAKPSDVECSIPNGLPNYPEPVDTTPDAPLGYKCVLLEKPVNKNGTLVYGKLFLYEDNKLQVVSSKAAREIIASSRIGGGEYLDWQEDAEWGNAPSFAEYIDCQGLKYTVIPLNEKLKEGFDGKGVLVSEELYKTLLSSSSIEWIDIK